MDGAIRDIDSKIIIEHHMERSFMPIILDYQLREQIPHKATEFPVTYFHDELAEFPNWAAPFH